MGNSTSRVVGCFVPFHGKGGVDTEFLKPLDEGLGHSFCYVRPIFLDSPAITPSNSERFTVDSSTLDSDTLSGSFRHDVVEEATASHKPIKSLPETTFRTISGASVSANVSTARTGMQCAIISSDVQEPAAFFEGTSSFAAIPLQPIPHCSDPLNGFMSGPLERGFASGPLDKGGGFMSGPIEKGAMSGPLDIADKSNFSAPLTQGRQMPRFQQLMRSVSGPVRSTFSRRFSRHSIGSSWMQRFFLQPVTQFAWHPKEPKFQSDASMNSFEERPLEGEYRRTHNIQWAHGKAGEDMVQVVLSEEQGWLFIGIYDGFSGPDAPDFLMSHLYKALGKELEGLLWDYEEKSEHNFHKCNLLHKQRSTKDGQESSCSSEPKFGCSKESCDIKPVMNKKYNCSMYEAKDRMHGSINAQLPAGGNPHVSESISVSTEKLAAESRKSKRLYELLQMERLDGKISLSLSKDENHGSSSCDLKPSMTVDCSGKCMQEQRICSINCNGDKFSFNTEVPCTSGNEDGGLESEHQTSVESFNVSKQMHNTRKSLFSSKIRQVYLKQKSLRKKLFPWSYDWHRERACAGEIIEEPLGPIRRCKSGIINHDEILKAMARALESTEEAYMDMVEIALDKSPELALMGSCVLVMLMKDQDVYVMNLGDSRVILAQERPSDRHLNLNLGKDDPRHWNRSRESLVRMELDRISEESPMHNQNSTCSRLNKDREISICKLKMRAVQLSADHSTSVEEEVIRIKAEHVDDGQAIVNDRVKGQLKVTRAFGAGFLKKPRCNEALLEMFQIDYLGTAPYISCIPFVMHHRLSSGDRFLVLSSDGLYQYFSNEEVVAHIAWFMENVPEGDPAQYLIAELLFRAAKKNGMDFHELLDIPHGDRRKYHDDVSVMVVSLEGRIWKSSG